MTQPSSPYDNDNIQHPQPSADASPTPLASEQGADWEERIEFLRGLAAIVQQERLSEIEVVQGGVRISLKTAAAMQPPAVHALAAAPVPVADAVEHEHDFDDSEVPSEAAPPVDHGLVPIVTPMVGVFYRAQSPDLPPFVEVGSHVEVGQIVGLVEAMKTFNEITSEIEGVVAEIRAENGDLVETGMPLLFIRKS